MDGLKKRLNDSVQYRLSFSLAAVVMAIALAAGIFSFISAFHQAQELQDDVLFQIAALINQSDPDWTLPADGIELEDWDEDSWIHIQMLSSAVGPLHSTAKHRMPTLPTPLADGFHTVDSGGEAYRVFIKTTHSGHRIAVSQEVRARNESAYLNALNTLLPFLILIPILLIIIAQLIRKIFRPITALAHHIDARAENDLRPIQDNNIPSEVRPFILAMNRLLARVNESVNIQRRFVADAAHELRSPMTALSLQAERLRHMPMSDTAQEQLHILENGITRGRDLLNQLLSLSKAQAPPELPPGAVSIRHIYRAVLENLMPLAKAKQIDIGVLDGPDASVLISELDLFIMVKNLVDNAIRYTPRDGRVDLSIETSPQATLIRIADTGPGIPSAEQARIFDPFYRILGSDQQGSGLGLAIVQAIAGRLGASILLGFSNPQTKTGLTVTIKLPALD